MTTYAQKTIRVILDNRKIIGYDPRHIEGYMRLQYGTLDHLSAADFRREVSVCIQCINEAGRDMAERNAQSFGL